MLFLDPSDPQIRQVAHEWILEGGEVYVDCYLSASGQASVVFLVDTPAAFDALLARKTSVLTVLRTRQYPLRGTVDEPFLDRALDTIRNNEGFEIVSIAYYPEPIRYLEEGATHATLSSALRNLIGSSVGVGPVPYLPRTPQESAAQDVIEVICDGRDDTHGRHRASA
jgi:hypothetical protein